MPKVRVQETVETLVNGLSATVNVCLRLKLYHTRSLLPALPLQVKSTPGLAYLGYFWKSQDD